LVEISVQDAGERCLWLLSSGRFGCGGMGEGGVLNIKKTSERGSLFCVNSKPEGVQNENVMGKLESQDVGNIVWKRLMEVLGPYL
jgi:hypothetical protein